MLLKTITIAVLGILVLLLPVQQTLAMPELPKDIEQQLYDLGVIDKAKAPDELSMLNMFWAFGLANKNPILESGPMMDTQYGGAGNFASTGGWTLAKGDAMDHYSMHPLVTLTPEQQKIVDEVSKNIYRPCCGNSTYFPDCNHGMAMLGILELGASQGQSKQELYATAKSVNDVWFPKVEQKIGCTV